MARPISYDPDSALEKAMDLFWTHGYHAVSVEQLVRSTGLNRHSLYSRYGNKYGLLRSALARYCAEAERTIIEALSPPGSPRERIERLMRLRHPDADDGFWRRVLDRGCLLVRTNAELKDSHPDVDTDSHPLFETLERLLIETVQEGQALGEFRSHPSATDLGAVLMIGFVAPANVVSPDLRLRAFLGVLDGATVDGHALA